MAEKTPTPPDPPPVVYTDEHPEFPKMLYNHDTMDFNIASDRDKQTEMEGEGYSEDPFPPDPAGLTDAETAQLKALVGEITAAAPALAKLASETQTPPPTI